MSREEERRKIKINIVLVIMAIIWCLMAWNSNVAYTG